MDIDDRKHIEKIIIFLKMVENDYRIDLTSEMEWLRGLQQAKDEPSADLEKAATEYTFTTPSTIHEAFVAGAKWMEKQFEKVEGYELDWFLDHDHEYMCGFRFDEPVELPCEIFIKRKETL